MIHRAQLWIVDRLLEWRYPLNPSARVPTHRAGKFLLFIKRGEGVGGMGHWDVESTRGKFIMGWVDWNPQWRAYHFRPHPEAVMNGGSIAEVYAFLKEVGVEVGRFI